LKEKKNSDSAGRLMQPHLKSNDAKHHSLLASDRLGRFFSSAIVVFVVVGVATSSEN